MAHEGFDQAFDDMGFYENSYWQTCEEFDVVIVHKGFTGRFKGGWLEELLNTHTYAFGNEVFLIFIKPILAKERKLSGEQSHLDRDEILKNVSSYSRKKPQPEVNILLVTAGNSGNLGDDIIALAAKALISQEYPDAHITEDKAPADKKEIQNYDLIVLGGGGLFYETCLSNVINYCQYFHYANEFDIPICAIGIGAHAIQSERGIEMFKHALKSAAFIAVRDLRSYKILYKRLSLPIPVLLRQDTALSLYSPEKNKQPKQKKAKPLLLFSLLDTESMLGAEHDTTYRVTIFECVAYLQEHFEICLMVQSKDDLNLYQELQDLHGFDVKSLDYSEADQAIDVYRAADLVLTSRLHGFILATLAGVPVLPVTGKRGKLGGIIQYAFPSLDSRRLLMKEFNVENLKKKIEEFMVNPQTFVAASDELRSSSQEARQMGQDLKQHIGQLR